MKFKNAVSLLLLIMVSLVVGWSAAAYWTDQETKSASERTVLGEFENTLIHPAASDSTDEEHSPLDDDEDEEEEVLTIITTVTATTTATVVSTVTDIITTTATATVTEVATVTEAATVTATATATVTSTVTKTVASAAPTVTVTVREPSSASECSTCSMNLVEAFNGVRDAPGGWAAERPQIPPVLQEVVKLGHFGDTGREMLDTYLLRKAEEQDVVTVLEIGSWLGHSVRRWALVSPKVSVISVDPYKDKDGGVEGLLSRKMDLGKWASKFNTTQGEFAALLNMLKGDGTYQAVQDHLWSLKERVALVQGNSPAALAKLKAPLPCVDVVYIDGGKTDDFLDHVAFLISQCVDFIRRFPKAVISGDDFGWGARVGHITSAEMAVRVVTHLMDWKAIVVGGRTWMMGPPEILKKYLPEYPTRVW